MLTLTQSLSTHPSRQYGGWQCTFCQNNALRLVLRGGSWAPNVIANTSTVLGAVIATRPRRVRGLANALGAGRQAEAGSPSTDLYRAAQGIEPPAVGNHRRPLGGYMADGRFRRVRCGQSRAAAEDRIPDHLGCRRGRGSGAGGSVQGRAAMAASSSHGAAWGIRATGSRQPGD